MLKILRDEWIVRWKSYAWMYGLVVGGSLFGSIIFRIICHFAKDVDEFVPIGFIAGFSMLGMYVIIAKVLSLPQNFNLMVGMGKTRKRFFLVDFGMDTVVTIGAVLLLILLTVIEVLVNGAAFNEAANFQEPDLVARIIGCALLGTFSLLTVLELAGACVLRFQKYAMWTLWCLWMFLCLGGPKLIDISDAAPNSVVGRIFRAVGDVVSGFTPWMWVGIVVAGSFICLVLSYLIIRKESVKN